MIRRAILQGVVAAEATLIQTGLRIPEMPLNGAM
jgi:alpha-D-ribose 1-methylphosphonate 5-phosphate C-P lyase